MGSAKTAKGVISTRKPRVSLGLKPYSHKIGKMNINGIVADSTYFVYKLLYPRRSEIFSSAVEQKYTLTDTYGGGVRLKNLL